MIEVGIIVPNSNCPGWLIELVHRVSEIQGIKVHCIPVEKKSHVGPLAGAFLKLADRIMPGDKRLLTKGPPPGTSKSPSQLRLLIDPGSCSPEELSRWPATEVLRMMIGQTNAMDPLAGLSEWVSGIPVTHAVLVNLKDDSFVASACTRTFLTSFPKHASRVYCMLVNLIHDHLKKNVAKDGSITQRQIPPFPFGPAPTPHGNILATKAFLVTLSRVFNKIRRQLFKDDRWVLKTGSAQAFRTGGPQELKFLESPANTFWADPFIIHENGKTYVFVEDCPASTGKGHLSCIVLGAEGEPGSVEKILDKPYHLSYPNVFRYNDKWYMIPESSENLTIDLYESTDFPFKWIHRKTLLSDIRAFDSTLLWKDGRIWLFCTVCRHAAASPDDDLFIFHTDDLLEGNWIPHQLNPVKSDPYTSRPAGAIWRSGDEIFRPAQTGVPVYGHALVINKILELTTSTFRETTIESFLPGPGYLAMHTLNNAGDQVVVDVIPDRSRP